MLQAYEEIRRRLLSTQGANEAVVLKPFRRAFFTEFFHELFHVLKNLVLFKLRES